MRKRLLVGIVICSSALSFAAQWVALLENPGFERGDVGWEIWGDGDIRTEYHGINTKEGDNFLRLWTRSGWYQDFSVRPGATYELSAYVATADADALWGDAFGEVKIEWRNRDNEDVETGKAASVKFDADGNYDEMIPKDEWIQITLPVVAAPADATHCRVLMTIYTDGGDAGGGCALFDDIRIKKF